jgi:hypothetical protein
MNTRFSTLPLKLAAIVCLLVSTSLANAALITEGFTFSVADLNGGAQGVGTHFHSSTGGDFGNPAGKAEVGDFGSEEVRGLSEYDLTGLTVASSAFVTFDVFNLGGLFSGTNDFPFNGIIDVLTYTGNNAEDLSDFQAPGTAIGSFSTVGLADGSVLSFDVLSAFNDAIDNTDLSLGVHLQLASGTDALGGALTFDDFSLTTDNQKSVVPVPAAVWLFGTALIGFVGMSRRTKVA